MMIGASLCRDTRDRALDRCYRSFPCLADPARRSSLGLKVALVMLHLVFAGILFLFDTDLIEKTKHEPWYTALYVLLFVATLVQYFITSGSSPGYVVDAMRAVNETHAIFRKISTTSKQPASSKNGNVVITVDSSHSGRNVPGSNATSWTKLVMDLYPPGTSLRSLTCSYCNVELPPRAKHCHDCDRCVLQFDHHCVWLGTCIGQGNHCRFWWYICEETALCLWTGILYITFLKANISRSWWKDTIMIALLVTLSISLIFLLLLLLFHSYLVLTNQTTYELVRRRRIPYLSYKPILGSIKSMVVGYTAKGVLADITVENCRNNAVGCYAGRFLNEYILSVREFAEIYTTSVLFEAVFTVWSDCPEQKNLKKNQDHTHV